MKSNESKAVCVYRNMEYEQLTRAQLESARRTLQSLLNEWHKLEIGECQDINELLMRPESVFKSAVDKLIVVPDSGQRFAIKKEALLSTLDLPDPSQLYASAKVIRQQNFCGVPELWEVEGNQVILNETASEIYIDAHSVYARDEEKIKLAKDINKFCELYNSLNKRLNGELLQASPWAYNFFRERFEIKQKMSGGLYEISPIIEKLREWVSA
jgi:hypothetical protein